MRNIELSTYPQAAIEKAQKSTSILEIGRLCESVRFLFTPVLHDISSVKGSSFLWPGGCLYGGGRLEGCGIVKCRL